MEIAIAIVIGAVFGAVFGGLAAWFAAKARTAADVSALRSKADLAQERFADSENAAEKAREEASEWQSHATENEKMISTLEERVATLASGAETANEANAELKADVEIWRAKAAESVGETTRLSSQLDAANKRIAERDDDENKLEDRFKVIASDAISSNSESFLSAANEKVGGIVKPLAEELKRIERARNESQGSLEQQIKTLVGNNESLAQTTRDLKQALTRPQARGKWGEIQLRRVVELAGMTAYCDFQEQVSIPGENGKGADRPDVVVSMPSERTIVVDAKTPMNAYMESLDADSPKKRDEALSKHATQVRKRARELAAKTYWNKLEQSPEFVVMFLPGEFLLQAALEVAPDLFDQTVRNGVVIATPNTLIALLKTVELGWKEARIAEDAREIANLGGELYDRLATYTEHISKVGRMLGQAVFHYNKGVGSFDKRVSVSARKLRELGIAAEKNVAEMKRIDEPVSRSGANLKATNANRRRSANGRRREK